MLCCVDLDIINREKEKEKVNKFENEEKKNTLLINDDKIKYKILNKIKERENNGLPLSLELIKLWIKQEEEREEVKL